MAVGLDPFTEDKKCADSQYEGCVGPYNEALLTD